MYSYINSKYNRILYFLLGIYIILVFVFSLLLNDFFVYPKAFTSGNSWEISGVCINNSGYGTSTRTERFTSNGRTKAIFYQDDDFKELLKNTISANNSTDIEPSCIMISARENDLGGSITSSVVSNTGDIPALRRSFVYLEQNGDLYNYFKNKGFELSPIGDRSYQVFYYVNGTVDNAPFDIYTASFNSDVEYVNSPQDLYKYLVQGDDSVVNTGDPSQAIDSQIPTPQKVAVYKDSSSPTLVWSNPKGISNNSNIKVRIEWKPIVTLTHGLYDVHSIIPLDYELLYFDNINEYNSFCTLNNNGSPPPNVLNSYNTIYDSKVMFSGTGVQQDNDWANYYIVKNNVDWVSRVDPFGTNDLFGKGTYSGVRIPDLKYRIRYESESGVSDWIYSDREFDSDNVSGPSQHSSTHSRNASGDPVSNPTYTPNNDNKVIPQNEVDDLNDSDKKKSNSIFDFISGFFDTIITAITAIFAKLKEIVDSISNGTGSFFSFFADLFGAFPQLLGIFLLGLVVTVLLRVLGR